MTYLRICVRSVGEQGWRSGESARLPPMCPGFDSWTQRHMWTEFVGSLPCSERFSPGTSVFPFPQKPTFSLIWFDLFDSFIWFDLWGLQSPQLVEHLCSARAIRDLNKVIIIQTKRNTTLKSLGYISWISFTINVSQDLGYHIWWQDDTDYMNRFKDHLTIKEVNTNK